MEARDNGLCKSTGSKSLCDGAAVADEDAAACEADSFEATIVQGFRFVIRQPPSPARL